MNDYTRDSPGSTHRIDWIFEDPSFVKNGFAGSEVVQGSLGDCSLIAALSSACSKPELLEKICVGRDETCGVYGFVFYRDGEWIWTVVDDWLFLSEEDYTDGYDPVGKKAREHKKLYQTGSEALFFGSCRDPNETWLPLIEKAYAKVHGDYKSIDGLCEYVYPPSCRSQTTNSIFIELRLRKILLEELVPPSCPKV